MGVPHSISFAERKNTVISCDASEEHLVLSEGLFDVPKTDWLTERVLPERPVERCKVPLDYSLPFDDLPVLFGQTTENNSFFSHSDGFVKLGIDIAGTAFFMLTRYEELVQQEKCDEFGRFAGKDSIAFQEGFLMRPLINEYLELLWSLLQRIQPRLERLERKFKFEPTHDIDHPYRLSPVSRLGKTVLGDLLRRKAPRRALQHTLQGVKAIARVPHQDPYDTYDFLMDTSEANNIKSSFYFMSTGPYSLRSKNIQVLMKRIRQRGHAIGLHPNLGTSTNQEQLERELALISEGLEMANIDASIQGGRQHYLSWDAGQTWINWEAVGLQFDSSLGFADQIGFRCGICYPYRVFNLLERKPLSLKEHPLLVMDVTVFDYMGLSLPHAEEKIRLLREQVKLYGGTFITNWHNSWFDDRQEHKMFYQKIFRN